MPFARRVHEIGTAVKAQDEVAAEAMEEEAVFDALRRPAHQHQRLLPAHLGYAGRIEHRDERAMVIEDRGGGAGQAEVAREEMFGVVNDDGLPFGETGAERIGALRALRPDRARR